MRAILKPSRKPSIPNFSSGPCAKPPGWTTDWLAESLVGRSHRSKAGKQKLKTLIDALKRLLQLPQNYELAIVPGSDTGAVEMALWSLLGARGVDVLAWDVFGKNWVQDVLKELRLSDVRVFEADFGSLPDLSQSDCSRDIVFTANGTTAGVRVPDFSWIDPHREGLTICDATSFVCAHPIAWECLDVTTFSWQKCLGGEAAHGVLILSPRAIQRAETYQPRWPIPKLFRFAAQGQLDYALFEGQTLNTPSMLCVEDCLSSLAWAERVGGLSGLEARAERNAEAVYDWIRSTAWVENLAVDPATWSRSSICLRITDKDVQALADKDQRIFLARMAAELEEEHVAYDIVGHRGAPPGLRLWCGSTVETEDVKALLPWLEWAFCETYTKTFSSPSRRS